MSQLVLERAPLVIKLRDVLRSVAELRGEIGRPPAPVGDAESPVPPYFVLYPMDGGLGFFGPPLAAPESIGEFMVQVTYVGLTVVQAEAAADRGRSTLLNRAVSLDVAASLPFAALKVIDRRSEGAGALDVDATMVNVHERFTFACSI